jgi:hypothetical protein
MYTDSAASFQARLQPKHTQFSRSIYFVSHNTTTTQGLQERTYSMLLVLRQGLQEV